MLPEARALGALDAVQTYGLEKEAWARFIGTGLGALLGSAAADREDRTQGAILGGVMGYGLGAGASRIGHGIVDLGKVVLPEAQEAVAPGISRAAASAQQAARASMGMTPPVPPALPPAGARAAPQRTLAQRLFGFTNPSGTRTLGSVEKAVRAAPAWLHNAAAHFPKIAGEKRADFGIGSNIPGTPLSVSMSSKNERLPGMNRWVNRGVIERAGEALDLGLEPADVLEMERERGSLRDPALGAGIGAALTHFGLGGKAGITGAALGGFAGAGLGAIFNEVTAPARRRDAFEAVKGLAHERGGFPIRGQAHSTASASTPMLISAGGGVA